MSDVLQAAGAAAIGAAAGIFVVTFLGAPAVLAFAIVVGAGFFAGTRLAALDDRYQLTNRARARMMAYEQGLEDRMNGLRQLHNEVVQLGRAAMQLRDDVDRTWRYIEEFRRYTPRLSSDMFR